MASRPRLAAALITKNAGPRFEQVLDSIAWMDQIVILDSGSTDGTLELAEAAGAKVAISHEWSGFGAQRQRAQALVECEWVFWLDSDEVVTPELRQAIERVMVDPDPQLAYSVNRLNDFFGRFIRHSGWYPDRVVRLYATDHYRYDDALVHEKVDVPNKQIRRLDADLLHYTSDDFHDYMAKSLRYAEQWAQARYRKGKRTSIAGILSASLFAFLKKYLLKAGFLDGKHGLLLACQSSHYVFNKYLALWVRQRQD